MKFSEQLKTVRESLGLNQAEAAAILGCGKRTLEHWEAGTRTPLEITQEGAMNRLRATKRPLFPAHTMKLITVPNGRRVTIGAYVSTWRTLKAMPPRESVNGWQWYSVTVGEVLADFRHGVHDRINKRAGIVPPVDSPASQRRVARRLMDARNARPCECEWCGSLLPHWMPKHARFCDASCRRAGLQKP